MKELPKSSKRSASDMLSGRLDEAMAHSEKRHAITGFLRAQVSIQWINKMIDTEEWDIRSQEDGKGWLLNYVDPQGVCASINLTAFAEGTMTNEERAMLWGALNACSFIEVMLFVWRCIAYAETPAMN